MDPDVIRLVVIVFGFIVLVLLGLDYFDAVSLPF